MKGRNKNGVAVGKNGGGGTPLMCWFLTLSSSGLCPAALVLCIYHSILFLGTWLKLRCRADLLSCIESRSPVIFILRQYPFWMFTLSVSWQIWEARREILILWASCLQPLIVVTCTNYPAFLLEKLTYNTPCPQRRK